MFHVHNLRIPHLKIKNTLQLSFVRLFFALGFAFIDTIWAAYMRSLGLTDSAIGYINAGLLIISMIFLFYCVNILEKFSERKSFFTSTAIIIILTIIFGITTSIIIFLFLAVILTLSNILRRNSFEILFRDNSPPEKLTINESILAVITNIGWFLGPIIAGFVLAIYGFSTVFFTSAFFSIISLLMFLRIKLSNKSFENYQKKSFKYLFLNFIKNTEVKLPYIMSMGVAFWWGFIFIYLPLFILDSGIGEQYIGIFVGLTQLPLIFFEYFAGRNSSKNGFRGSFFFGYLFLGLMAISCFFFAQNIFIVMLILVLASIAMAFVEPLRFPFVFSRITTSQEDDIIPIYSSSMSLGSLSSKIIVATILLFLANDYAYLIVGFFMILFALAALKIKK